MGSFVGELPHLARRFFGTFGAAEPTAAEQDLVAELLSEPESALFFAQRVEDQRHALDVAERAGELVGREREVMRAALLHDVGKIRSDLGPLGRTAATILDAMGVPLRGRLAEYRNHGEIGAELLSAAGAEPLVVQFARHHPQTPARPIEPHWYRSLLDADRT